MSQLNWEGQLKMSPHFSKNNLKAKRSRSSYGKCLGQSLISAATDYLMG